MDGGVEGALGSGAEPEVPIHAGGWFGVGDLLPCPARGVSKGPDQADLADLARLQELHAGERVRRDATMQAYLDLTIGFTGRADHGVTFVDGVANRLFDIDMSAGFDGRDGGQGVPMVGRGDNDNIRTLLGE